MQRKYALPPFLSGVVTQEVYELWLRHKAKNHVRRDRKRGNATAIGESYREAIHSAVVESAGLDAHTGEVLHWNLISQYDNDKSKQGGRHYKHEFALLPTVDHVGDDTGAANFKICGWRTNDAKNDLDVSEFLSVCEAVLKHHDYVVSKAR